MKKWMSKYWAVPGVAGLALAVSAVFLAFLATTPVARAQTATPTVTSTPAPTATPNPGCDLRVTKADSPDPVSEGGQITYTITVENNADENGSCDGIDVTDEVPSHTDCVSASVTDSNDLDFDDGDISDTCDDNDAVEWIGDGDLDDGDSVTLKMVVELDSSVDGGDEVNNEACATSDDDENGDCDRENTDVTSATATPTTAPTATARPPTTVIAPPPPPPPVAILPTLSPPVTGTGSGDGGSSPLAIGLGLAGLALLLGSGAVLVKRSR